MLVKAITLTNFINKYGEDEGKKRYSNITHRVYSKISQVLFRILDEELGNIAIDSRFEEKNGEQIINIFFDNGICKTCRPDYILHTKIIEFNGDFWHANPLFYNENDVIYTGKNNTIYTASDIWEQDLKRKEALEKLGYKVKVIWEKDFYENKEKVIQECLQFLKA